MQLMYQLSITAAGHTIDLSSAYFVPDELTSKALTDALKRGVKIRIITPGEIIDTDTVRAASRGTCIFEVDLRNARQVTYEKWADRPLKEKLTERLALLLGSQL